MNWLFKTEPGTYSFDTLAKEKTTAWNGVRNYQARNFLRECKKGEFTLIYHSGDAKAVVGLARITKEGYPDPDSKKKGDWVQLDLKYALTFKTPVTLAALKTNPKLKNLPLIKHTRLSCMPVPEAEFKIILETGGVWADFQKLK